MFSTAIIANIIKYFNGNLFLYPGGTIAPLLKECKNIDVNLIVSKSEQGAGYMALADALKHNKPAFCAVTSGPGATNIITTVADAYYDSVPLIIFTGQVGTADLERSSKIRQRGFQEVPIVNMLKEVTKCTFQPKSVEELALSIHEAYKIASSGRKGPVLIDLPMNIQLQEISETDLEKFLDIDSLKSKGNNFKIQEQSLVNAIEVLNSSKKPLILLGGGAQEYWNKIRNFISDLNFPVISSLRGLGVFDSKKSYGWIGHTGFPWSNKALYEADCVLVLGSRLDIRQTGSETKVLDEKKVIHVDLDINELEECRIKNTIKINCSILDFIESIQGKVLKFDNSTWYDRLEELKNTMFLQDDLGSKQGVTPSSILKSIDEKLDSKKTLFTTGVGSHQHWVSRYINFDNEKKSLFTSAGHGTMGYGLPVALGLNYLDKSSTVICVDGDGSFQMNIQELALIKELDLNLKILLLDNSRLGIVSQFQQITFSDDPTTGDFKNPNFTAIADAYGLKSFYMDSYNEDTISKWLDCEEPTLLHVKIKHDSALSPMLLGGQKLDEMWYEA